MNDLVLDLPLDVSSDDGRLVAKAVVRAGAALGLKQAEVGEVIGVSASQVSKMKDAVASVPGKSFELSVYLIRIFRSLDAIAGGDSETVREWMRNANADLNGVPSDLIKTTSGLVAVMNYLDAARAPI